MQSQYLLKMKSKCSETLSELLDCKASPSISMSKSQSERALKKDTNPYLIDCKKLVL